MTSEPLSSYQSKRDFARTPEPGGTGKAVSDASRFVVQEHHARRLHWDFRLERDGVLVSWALPRGFPDDPREDLPAVETEDHPLEYLDFEGTIPEGSYGAGSVTVWDRGTYVCEAFEDGTVVVELHGNRLRGRYALYRARDDWRIHRIEPPDPDRTPMPERVVPMLAQLGDLPADGDRYCPRRATHLNASRTPATCSPPSSASPNASPDKHAALRGDPPLGRQRRHSRTAGWPAAITSAR